MEKNNVNENDLIVETAESEKSIFEKTKTAIVKAIDRNDDGIFDKNDLSDFAGAVGGTIKDSASSIKSGASSIKTGVASIKTGMEEKSQQKKLKSLQPIFYDMFEDKDFSLPKFIRITERDKKHSESELCRNSIGYYSEPSGYRLINIYRDCVDLFNLSLYPDSTYSFYYVDPSDRDQYIALEEYFGYLKIARVNELQMIAQNLGAKFFRVTYKEEGASAVERKANYNINLTKSRLFKSESVINSDGEHYHSEAQYSTVEIAAEMSFPGHSPEKPQLKYLQRDPSIQTLISMRMDKNSPLSHQKYMLKMSNSMGVKESDAIEIDAVLKSLKSNANVNFASEVRSELRRYLEYEIDF